MIARETNPVGGAAQRNQEPNGFVATNGPSVGQEALEPLFDVHGSIPYTDSTTPVIAESSLSPV